MWDPLLNEFPETVHGLRCMLAVKYCQLLEQTYAPDTVGYNLLRDLISVIRSRDYVEATRRYSHFNSRIQGTPTAELRQPRHDSCCCPHCPRHKSKAFVDLQAHESQTQNVQDVQKP
uniref:Protein V2 n=1 Tax=Sida yellow mosaic China virus - [Hainan 8] TaxID=290090 RepID=Q68V39_9GEMI|nr:AV2 protein [Sida yellow mosaic China virus - [Hainan 8]]